MAPATLLRAYERLGAVLEASGAWRALRRRRGVGLDPAVPRQRDSADVIWVHGASLGEALSVRPIVDRLLCEPSKPTVLWTASSRSMLQVVPREYAGCKVVCGLAPLDLPGHLDAFLDAWRPSAGLWVESELWPTTLRRLRDREVPLALVQARLSERSLGRWRRVPGGRAALAELLGSFEIIVAQSLDDARRVQAARGAAQPLPLVTDLKRVGTRRAGDVQPEQAPLAGAWRRMAWIAGSTHPGEELELARAHCRLAEVFGAPWTTVLAPRHPRRVKALERELAAFANVQRLSRVDRRAGPPGGIVLVDSLGELARLYEGFEVAFVGGSLQCSALHGAHNVHEPRRAGCGLVLRGDAGVGEADGACEVRGCEDIVRAVSARLLASGDGQNKADKGDRLRVEAELEADGGEQEAQRVYEAVRAVLLRRRHAGAGAARER